MSRAADAPCAMWIDDVALLVNESKGDTPFVQLRATSPKLFLVAGQGATGQSWAECPIHAG